MIAKHHLAGLLAAVVAAAAPGAVVAEEGSGSVTYLSIWAETFDLPSGAKVHRNYNKGVVLADDSAIPFNLATQDCRGSRVIGADGAVTFDSGFCDTIDVECDMWTLWYRNDAAGRSWEVIGGTGKYGKMTGGGTTKVLLLTRDGRTTIRWAGSWER